MTVIQEHAWEIAQAVSSAILEGEDVQLETLSLKQLVKIRDIVENETYEYLKQLEENGKLQIGD